MLVNLAVTALGIWGCYYTWTRRSKSGGSTFFDVASPVRNPLAYKFAIGLRLVVFGLCAGVGGYRAMAGITD